MPPCAGNAVLLGILWGNAAAPGLVDFCGPSGRAAQSLDDQLGRQAMIALWALRVLVIILSAMVIYTFFSQLGS